MESVYEIPCPAIVCSQISEWIIEWLTFLLLLCVQLHLAHVVLQDTINRDKPAPEHSIHIKHQKKKMEKQLKHLSYWDMQTIIELD